MNTKAIQEFIVEELFRLEPHIFTKDFRSFEPLLQEKREMVRKEGWWAPHMPKQYGGMGLNLMELAQLSEILGQSPVGHFVFGNQAPDAGNMEVLKDFGSPEQKETYLAPLVRGDIRSCFSMTEPDFAGSNPVHMATRAIREGDEYVINGRKWFTTGADGASFAIVMCVTDPEAATYNRASQIIVPTDTKGFHIERNISIMGDPNSGWFSHSEIQYTDVRVPIHNLIGGEGEGFQIAQQRLGPGRIHHCMRWIGICERALALMCTRASTRMLDTHQPLASKQAIQFWIAEARAKIDAARLLVLNTAKEIEEKGSHGARKSISIIKFYVADVLEETLNRAIQVHGALGITDDTPLAFWYRHERGARIYDGPDEVHKSRVARMELKRYMTQS